jgi:hypothetical protein
MNRSDFLKKLDVSEITPINIEWNSLNGFMLSVCKICINSWEGALFGLSFGWKSYFYIDILFFNIVMYEKKRIS